MNETESEAAGHTMRLIGGTEAVADVPAMLRLIEEKLRDLLLNDFNSLFSLLYRIDIREDDARTCFGKPNEEIAACLAALIWRRQLQKAQSRQAYRDRTG